MYPKYDDASRSIKWSANRTTYYHTDGAYEFAKHGDFAASDLSAPIVICDTIEVQSQADGKTYTSKRGLRHSYREQGVIEMGDERPTRKKQKPKGVKDTIEKAFAQAS